MTNKTNESFVHQPVMLQSVIHYLQPAKGDVVVDGTLGGAGHSAALAQYIGPEGTLIGIDRDDMALRAAKERLAHRDVHKHFVHDNFAHLDDILTQLQIDYVDRILFDFGVSSPQLDIKERGFSYHDDAPLDMRMDRSQQTTAHHVINTASQQQLTRIISQYGEERWAGRIAANIVRERQQQRIETTTQLANIVKRAIPAAARRRGPHPARRTFQALRIAVNGELEAIESVLPQAIRRLRPGGRLAVISFHSLEDRIVKQQFQIAAQKCQCPPRLPVCQCNHQQLLRIVTRKPIVATEQELASNPRARSAKLRVAERVLGSGERE